MKPEKRITPAPGTLEEPNRLFGYAAKFDEESSVLYDEAVCKGPFVEVIRRGAFADSLRDHPDVRALFDHKSGAVLGRTRSGTLAIREDDIGLYFDLQLPDTTVGRDARELVRRGDIDGCSFGFFVVEDVVTLRRGKPALRELLKVHVFEITPATAFPAYEATSVNLRSKRTEHAPEPAERPHLGLAMARLRLARD